MVVMVFISLFSAVLLIRLQGPLSKGDLGLASRMIMNQINRTRGAAAYGQQEQLLGFSLDDNSLYQVDSLTEKSEVIAPAEAEKRGIRELPQGVVLEDLVISAREKIHRGEAVIRFFPNGSSERVLIHLKNQEGYSITLFLNPLTGYVEVRKGYVDERQSP